MAYMQIANFSIVAQELNEASKNLEASLPLIKSVPVDISTGFDFEKELSKTNLPISFFHKRLRTLSSLFVSLPDEVSREVFSVTQLRELISRAEQVKAKAIELKVHVDDVKSKGGFKATTWANIEIGTADGVLNYELEGAFLLPILNDTDRIIESYSQILVLIDPDSLKFRHAAEAAETSRIIVEKVATDVTSKKNEIIKLIDEIGKLSASAKSELTNVSKTSTDTSTAAKKFSDGLSQVEGEINQKKGAADAVLNAATDLKKQVDDYLASFLSFQKMLNERNAAWKNGQENLEKLFRSLGTSDLEIKRIVEKANEMLSTATNAGLTAAQHSKFKDLGDDLKSAETSVNWSYFFLALSMLPLGGYVVLHFGETIKFEGGLEYLANIVLRSLLLFPAILFVSFTSSRHKKLFRLKHEYGYRASLAGAVEGFQKRAPDHEKDIAAVAFYQLGRNPAESIDGHAPPPMWYEKLNKIIHKFGDRFGDSNTSQDES